MLILGSGQEQYYKMYYKGTLSELPIDTSKLNDFYKYIDIIYQEHKIYVLYQTNNQSHLEYRFGLAELDEDFNILRQEISISTTDDYYYKFVTVFKKANEDTFYAVVQYPIYTDWSAGTYYLNFGSSYFYLTRTPYFTNVANLPCRCVYLPTFDKNYFLYGSPLELSVTQDGFNYTVIQNINGTILNLYEMFNMAFLVTTTNIYVSVDGINFIVANLDSINNILQENAEIIGVNTNLGIYYLLQIVEANNNISNVSNIDLQLKQGKNKIIVNSDGDGSIKLTYRQKYIGV